MDVYENDLRNSCERLVETVRDAVESGRIGGIVQCTVDFLKPKVTSLEYKDGIAQVSREFRQESMTWLRGSEDHETTRKKIAMLPEYQAAVGLAVQFSSLARETCEDLVARFVDHACLRPHYYIDDPISFDYLPALLADLRKEPIPWRVNSRLIGVWPESVNIRLSSDQVLRPLRAADFEQKNFPFSYQPRSPFGHDEASAALEWTLRAEFGGRAQQQLLCFLSVLRLFRVGSVDYLNHDLIPLSFREIGSTGGCVAPKRPRFVYQLMQSDVTDLEELNRKIAPLIMRHLAPFTTAEKGDDIGIAYERYRNALFEPGQVEAVITTAITALEALFLENDGELKRRLAQRVAILMRVSGYSSLEVHDRVAQAYKIRSGFIHGSGIEANLRDSYRPLCGQIMEYVRMAIVVALQLRPLHNKQKFLKMLDDAMLEENSLRDLQTLITSKVTIPIGRITSLQ